MHNIIEKITIITEKRTKSLSESKTKEDLENIRILLLGRKGLIADLMDDLKTLSIDDKKIYGPLINQLKSKTQNLLDSAIVTIQ
jgi:phenylalanyl-tRNA synthetase alpha chain